jgi:hypothetical protein
MRQIMPMHGVCWQLCTSCAMSTAVPGTVHLAFTNSEYSVDRDDVRVLRARNVPAISQGEESREKVALTLPMARRYPPSPRRIQLQSADISDIEAAKEIELRDQRGALAAP